MKYIRTTTPTNIYSLEPTFIVDRTDVTCFKTHGNKGRYVNDTIETEENLEKWLKYNKTSILKQADTIEELSDYVIRKPSGSVDDRPFILKYIIHKGYLNRNNYEEIREELKKQYEMQKKGDKAIIYLAIATDKGLIYVAKMNEKGELELL